MLPVRKDITSFIGPRQKVRKFTKADCESFGDLSKIGIGIDSAVVRKIMHAAMDANIPSTLTVSSITTPVQFLQNWLPGLVNIITAARKIDKLIGIATQGSWEDEEIVQGVMEVTGTAVPYGDTTNVPFSSWNLNFNKRTVVRFEEGLRVGILEEKRAARVRVNSAEEKREGAGLALEIQRNAIGFFGYNGGNNQTYGFLNDPALPAYVTVAATGTGTTTTWSTKTYLNITADLREAISALRTQSQDVIDPEETDITLALPTDAVDYLSVSTDFGYSVRQWLTETYPKIRVVSAPELDQANGGQNVFYLYAEKVEDMSTDGGATFIQVVPAKFQLLGVSKLTKFYEEDYSNATAGSMCKRPYAVVRRSGI